MDKILIVDDEQAVIDMLRELLEKNGYACKTAENSEEARKFLTQDSFELMISDIHMPEESGVDLARYAKTEYPRMAQIIMTAQNDPEIAQSLLKAGIYGYILKPFSIHQMLIAIQNALIRRELEIQTEEMKTNLENMVRQRTDSLERALRDLEKARAKSAATAQDLQDQLLLVQAMRDAIPSPIYYKDTTGCFRGCNKAFEDYIGLQRTDIIGKTVYDIVPKAYADVYARADAKLLEKGGQQSDETVVPKADGSLLDVHFIRSTYKNSEGRMEGLVGVMIDVTERKTGEMALRQSEEKMRQILDNVGIGVAVISPQMRLLEMNKKMRQWFPEAAIEQPAACFQIFVDPGRKVPCKQCPTLKTLQDGRVHESTLITKAPNGHRMFRIISSAIRDKDGKVAAAIELVEDITQRTAMERELLQTSKMASIGQLAAGVAHEINNPTGFVSSNLNTLKGYTSDLDRLLAAYRALKEAASQPHDAGLSPAWGDLIKAIEAVEKEIDIDFIRQDTEELIRDCIDGTDRIKKIVEDLKHFAHPGQDKVQDTDINKELETTLNVVHNELKYKAEVIKELGQLPIIKANPQQLNQVFVNILVNAAQAIEKMGKIRIKTLAANGFARIEISDTGCGIAPENLNKIFEPFFTTKEVGKGTGLGMNIAYNIIQKHQGVIKVTSEVGLGTTFTIDLPITQAAESLN